MTFEKLLSILDYKVRNGIRVKWDAKDVANCKSDEYKMGIYYVFNKKDQVEYVGMVGDVIYMNLHSRCFGHGWESIEDVKEIRGRLKDPSYVLFRRFGNYGYNKAYLKLVRCLLILKIRPKGVRIPNESNLRKGC